MARYKRREERKEVEKAVNETINHEGGQAFELSERMALYQIACTTMMNDQFYQTSGELMTQLRQLVESCGPAYTVSLADYTRNKMNLRTISLVLLAEAARVIREGAKWDGNKPLRYYVPRILRRADEPGEFMGYWKDLMKKVNTPKAIKRGISDALNGWNEYQLGKYDSARKNFRMRDIIRLSHPKPRNEEQSALFRNALDLTLKTPETWETYISANGSTAETWDAIAPKMGIMALVRNLRNFQEKGAEKALTIAVEAMRNPQIVRESRMLPFRWLSAYREVSGTYVLDALCDAMDLSVKVIPEITGSVAVFGDNSGSMEHEISPRSKVCYMDIAGMMAAICLQRCSGEVYSGVFGEQFKLVGLSRRSSILANAMTMRHTNVGHATYAHFALEWLISSGKKVDKVFIFSDEQTYTSNTDYYHLGQPVSRLWEEYRKKCPKATLYAVNLSGYGTSSFDPNQTGVVQIAGWSERIFEMVEAIDKRNVAVQEIAAI